MAERPVFAHLASLTTELGLHEHALLTRPRPEHGYCVDDVARALVVTTRESDQTLETRELTGIYLRFLLAAQDPVNGFHNRRDAEGHWVDQPSFADHWGRALWALGVAAEHSTQAREGAHVALLGRSRWTRATAYAALGAAALVATDPDDELARLLLADARTQLPRPSRDPFWPWPELSLTYANAVLPEALIAVGVAMQDGPTLDQGLALLTWLAETETLGTHLSVTPAGGWRRGQGRPGFDQQPIEVNALAEACTRAFTVTGDARWVTVVQRCAAWFSGDNDAGLPMYDPVTGAGFDGLHRAGVNQNQGAESTLAALGTFQCLDVVRQGVNA